MNAKERIRKGEIKPSDVSYEQRQGSYDNTDVNVGYVPSGMSVHEWHELQRLEKREMESKEFGKIGPKGFMSRSLQAFQEDLDKGKVCSLCIEILISFDVNTK
jgi:urocanate hydratase